MKRAILVFVTLSSLGLAATASAAVTASLDRDQVADGETVQLVLQHDGSGGGDPDLGPLKKDFDVLSTSSGSNIQIVNGSMSAQRELRLTLAPKHRGRLQIPPLTWAGEQSEPLTLTVADAGSGNSAGGSPTAGHVFVTSSVDQAQPYVQGAVVLTVQLHADEPLYHASLDFSGNNDVVVQQLGQDRKSTETRNGHRYDVIERQYLLQPQRSGKLSLDGPTLDAQVADAARQDPFGPNSPFADAFGGSPFAGMLNATKPLRLHADPIELDVLPRPPAATGGDWLPARSVTLEASSTPDTASLRAGDPLTLHLRLRAEGLTAAQLPDLSAELSLPEGLKAYPDQAKLDTSLQSGKVVGSREQDIAIIASRPGRYELPSLHLSWWDTTRNAQRELSLPAKTLEVLPGASAAADSVTPQADHSQLPAPEDVATRLPPQRLAVGAGPGSPWPWISLALGVLWLGTLAAWWRGRRSRADVAMSPVVATEETVMHASTARKAFQQACRGNDALAARRSLLNWARAAWPDRAPTGLGALAARLDDERLSELLRQLDRACFAGADWNGSELAERLTSLGEIRKTRRQQPVLADLYP